MAWEVVYAAIRLVYSDDGKSDGIKPPERLAIRIRAVPCLNHPSDALNNHGESYDYLLWLGDDPGKGASPGRRYSWYDTVRTEHSSCFISSGGGGPSKT